MTGVAVSSSVLSCTRSRFSRLSLERESIFHRAQLKMQSMETNENICVFMSIEFSFEDDEVIDTIADSKIETITDSHIESIVTKTIVPLSSIRDERPESPVDPMLLATSMRNHDEEETPATEDTSLLYGKPLVQAKTTPKVILPIWSFQDTTLVVFPFQELLL